MTAPRPPRVPALDLLRGIAVAAMIVVNNPGNWSSVFPQLTHASWNGVTAADLIFPAFIFIMGVAMAFTLSPRPARRRPGAVLKTPRHDERPGSFLASTGHRASMYRRVAVRGLTLVLLGLVLNIAAAWPDVASARIPGVLQRIGITYMATAVVMLNAGTVKRWMLAVSLLLLHWSILGAGGSLEPGQSIAAALDRGLFGSHTLTALGDPEGALGLLSSVSTALFGAVVGGWVGRDATRDEDDLSAQRIRLNGRLALAGTSAILAGYAWSFLLPLNKSLWTGSFAVLSSGAATLSLAACYRLEQWRRALSPFLWLGVNPLTIYFLSEFSTTIMQRPGLIPGAGAVGLKDLLFWNLLVPIARDNGGPLSSLVYAVAYLLVWIGAAGVLQRKRIRIRL